MNSKQTPPTSRVVMPRFKTTVIGMLTRLLGIEARMEPLIGKADSRDVKLLAVRELTIRMSHSGMADRAKAGNQILEVLEA